MWGLYKTKAALQGRQCHNTKTQQSQDITVADQVNNYGKIPVFIGVAYLQHDPVPQGNAEGGKPPSLYIEGRNPPSLWSEAGNPASEASELNLPPYLAFGSCKGCSDVSNGHPDALVLIREEVALYHFVPVLGDYSYLEYLKLFFLRLAPNHPSLFPSSYCSRKLCHKVVKRALGKRLGHIVLLNRKLHICNKNDFYRLFSRSQPSYYCFSLSAKRFKRSRHASLTHALNWPGPAALSICSKSSSSKRMFFFVLPDRSKAGLVFLSCIGTYRYCRLKVNGTYQFVFVQPLNAAKPGSVTSTNRASDQTVK